MRVHVPPLLPADLQALQPVALDVADLLLHVLQLGQVAGQVLALAELSWRQAALLDAVNDALVVRATSRRRLGEEARLREGAQFDNGAQPVRQVLENDAADGLDRSLAHDGTAKFEVGSVEADLGAVSELDGGGPTQPTRQTVLAHLANKFVVSVHAVGVVRTFEQVVRDGRVVARVLAVVARAIGERSLVRLAEQRVKWFVLACAEDQARQSERDHGLEARERIWVICCLQQVLWRARPDINDALD